MSEYSNHFFGKSQYAFSITSGRIMQLLKSKLGSLADSHFEEGSQTRRLELSNMVKIYFDFTYYLGASPFRFERDVSNRRYYLKVWKLQQLICAMLHTLCVFLLVSEIRKAIPENMSSTTMKNPTPYFDIVLRFCSLFYKLDTMRRFWLNKEQYQKILNYILKENFLPVRNKMITKPYFLYTLFGVSLLKILACLISGYDFVIPIWKWSPSWWFRRLVAHGRFVFCFGKNTSHNEAPDIKDTSFWDVLLAIFIAVGQCERWVLADACDFCVLICAFTMWTTASSFSEDITDMLRIDEQWDEQTENGELPRIITVRGIDDPRKAHSIQPWSIIYRNFQAIKNLSDIVNASLGSQVTWYMAEGLMYYSGNLNSVILTNDEFRRVYKLTFYVGTITILYVSADVCTKMESLKQWLVKDHNIKTVPRDEANLVLHEDLTKDIGIRGSNAFTITFPLVAGYLSLIVTFFVICVQQSDSV